VELCFIQGLLKKPLKKNQGIYKKIQVFSSCVNNPVQIPLLYKSKSIILFSYFVLLTNRGFTICGALVFLCDL